MSVLDKVRKWIDGETNELVLEDAARDAQVKPRSQAEEFIVKIAREVEGVMQNEMVPLPQGTTIIPTEYTIFLSDEDDKNWQGAKRRGLEQGLYHILAERAKEIAGKKKLETQSFAVQLRVDGTLEQGDIRVQHSWEDPNANKTSILSRMKPNVEIPPKPVGQNQPPPSFSQNQPVVNDQPPPTMLPGSFQPAANNFQTPQQATPISSEETGEEMTHVQKRAAPELYKLEIWRGGVRQNVVPVYQNQISIGRGSKSKPVDISLQGDPEISRRHLTFMTDGKGNFSMINEGRNPAIINNYELPLNQQISISPGVPINVCTYMLRIQPK
ncbi:MAG TPA: FhaA domain-containing protein [Pyrinomonadaceae bacterium]|nr:FhaA domain-containing protein [Pyrinomonadaceae bacterium]